MHTSKHVSVPLKHFLQPNRAKGQRASAGVNTITNSTSCRCAGRRKPGVCGGAAAAALEGEGG